MIYPPEMLATFSEQHVTDLRKDAKRIASLKFGNHYWRKQIAQILYKLALRLEPKLFETKSVPRNSKLTLR